MPELGTRVDSCWYQGVRVTASVPARCISTHPDRNAQFEYINRKAKAALRIAQPVIAVDTKKKELVDRYKNGGRVDAAGKP